MKALDRRVRNLEGKGSEFYPVWIIYHCHKDQDEEAPKAAAIAEWEAENGPLANRVPNFISIRHFAPPNEEAV